MLVRKRIFLAGPYSDNNIIGILANIRQGIEVAGLLMAKGYSVFCPFLDAQISLTQFGALLSEQDYKENSLAWVEVADAVLCLSGWELSKGTLAERGIAEQNNIPIFISVESLEEWANNGL